MIQCLLQKNELERKVSSCTFQEVSPTKSDILVKHLQEELHNYVCLNSTAMQHLTCTILFVHSRCYSIKLPTIHNLSFISKGQHWLCMFYYFIDTSCLIWLVDLVPALSARLGQPAGTNMWYYFLRWGYMKLIWFTSVNRKCA